MGGGSYDRDVSSTPVSRREVFRDTAAYRPDPKEPGRRAVHPDLNILDKVRECCDSAEHPDTTPIVIAMDVTKSRGEDAVIIYNKMPRLIGQVRGQGIIPHPAICLAGIGDATCDNAPIQVSQFEADTRIDKALEKLWLEEGGGGTGQESYELLAYYLAKKTKLDSAKRGKLGYLFFLGDEGFYPKVSASQVKLWIGDDLQEDVASVKIFKELQKKFKVFFIYPQKKWEEQQRLADLEIRDRVRKAGGRVEGVDIRASLVWENTNDLDLHCITPNGEEIYYGRKQDSTGGWLDVDMNVRGETMKPVENIQWKKGTAPSGKYKFSVHCYSTHTKPDSRSYGDCFPAATDFRVEIVYGGEIFHYTGRTPEGRTGTSSNTTVLEFEFDPTKDKQAKGDEDKYANYRPEVILGQWGSVLPKENILVVQDPKACVDVMLGAIELTQGRRTLDDYLKNLGKAEKDGGVGQTTARCEDVRNALSLLAAGGAHADVQVASSVFRNKGGSGSGKKKSARL